MVWVLCKANGGVGGMEKGSMVALKRGVGQVNGGIEKDQWGYWSGGALVRVNGGD